MKEEAGNTGFANRTAKLIKKYREDHDLTQLDMAKKVGGYNYSNFIGMLEAGKAKFPMNRWQDFAEAMEMDKTTFLLNAVIDCFPDAEAFVLPLLKKQKK